MNIDPAEAADNTPDDQIVRCDVPNGLLRRLDVIAPTYIQGQRNKSARARWAIEEFLRIMDHAQGD